MRSPSRASLCDPSLRSRRTARPSMETRKRKATKCVSHPKNVGKRSKAAISLTTSKVDDDVETRRPILVGRPDVLSFDALPDAVILAVIELLDVRDVVALARTCRRCRDVGLSLPMWRSHCKCRFNILGCPKTKCYSEVYELFHKVSVVASCKYQWTVQPDQDYWMLVFCAATTDSKEVQYLGLGSEVLPTTLFRGKAMKLWGLSSDELKKYYKGEIIHLNHGARTMYIWKDLYQAALEKYGSRENLQVALLKRCFRIRLAVNMEFDQSTKERRLRNYEKWWQRNQSLAASLTRHMPSIYDVSLAVPYFHLHSVTDDYRVGHHPASVKLRTVHHYATFCHTLQSWLSKISDVDIQRQMLDEYTSCLKYIYSKLSARTFREFVDATSFFKAALEFYGHLKPVLMWQYEKGRAYQAHHRPSSVIKEHPSYKKYMFDGDKTALASLKAAFEHQERLRLFLDDNRWLTQPLMDRIEQEALTDPQSGLFKDLLQGIRADSGSKAILDAVKSFLDSGSDDEFYEFVHQLKEKLTAKVETLNSLVKSLDRYVVPVSKKTNKKKAHKALQVSTRATAGRRRSARLISRINVAGGSRSLTDRLRKEGSPSQMINEIAESKMADAHNQSGSPSQCLVSTSFPNNAYNILLIRRLEAEDYSGSEKETHSLVDDYDTSDSIGVGVSNVGSTTDSERTERTFGNTSSYIAPSDLLWPEYDSEDLVDDSDSVLSSDMESMLS